MRKNGKKGNGFTQGVLNGLEDPDATGLQLAAMPAPAQEQKSYLTQDAGMNLLARMRQVERGERANTTRDMMADTFTITSGAASLTIEAREVLTKEGNFIFPPATGKLLDFVGIEMTRRGMIQKDATSPIITIPLSRYMEIRGLTDRTAAREQVKKSCNILLHSAFTYEFKQGSKLKSYGGFSIADLAYVDEGDIYFRFGQTLYDTLAHNGSKMIYPAKLLATNDRRNPHSYPLGRKLAEHRRMNLNKPNENIIRVRSLLEAALDLPAYEDIRRGARQYDKRIREPFERDMDALREVLTWEYCHENNTPLTQAERESLKYGSWIELLVRVHWHDEPEQESEPEAKATKATKTAKKSRGAARTLKGGAAKGSTGARNEG